MLKRLGLDKAVAAAKSIEELRKITLDVDSAEIALAIRDALHPASGDRQEHFRGLKEGGLKLILKNRFVELKKTGEAVLRRNRQPDWTDKLILDKDGKIVANLANVILILRRPQNGRACSVTTSSTRGSLSDSARPGGRRRLIRPGPITMNSLTRVWFQSERSIHRR